MGQGTRRDKGVSLPIPCIDRLATTLTYSVGVTMSPQRRSGVDQAQAVRRIAQVLNDGQARGRSSRLARLMGTTLATVQSWAAAGESEHRKRSMAPTARRLLFLLLALHQRGVDLDDLRRSTRALEREYLGGDDE